MKNRLYLLIGNSGSGKDSILNYAITHWELEFPQIHVPRRYITRPPHETEPYFSVSESEFQSMREKGQLCFFWKSYGYHYGVPIEINHWLKQGHIVVVNVSREIVPDVRLIFPDVQVVFVKVPLAITTDRVEKRAREGVESQEFKERIKRAKENQEYAGADHVVENAGSLAESGEELKSILLSSVN